VAGAESGRPAKHRRKPVSETAASGTEAPTRRAPTASAYSTRPTSKLPT
jgi:hypothetical protein